MIKYSEEIKSMNLWEKVANISAEIENIQKDDSVGYGNNSYKAISIEKVVKIVGEKMNKYGVVIYPIQQNYSRTDEEVQKKDGTKGYNRISDVNVTYQVVNIHNPQEVIVTVASGTGVDTQDKGVGKAQTYAYKNMLLKLFAIPTGDDTDKIHSDDYTNKLYGEKPPREVTDVMVEDLYKIAIDKGYKAGNVESTAKKEYNNSVADLRMNEYLALKEKVEGLKAK